MVDTVLGHLLNATDDFPSTIRVAKYIDDNGPIAVNNGRVVNGRHVRWHLLQHMYKHVSPVQTELPEYGAKLDDTIKKMIELEKTTGYTNDVSGMRFFNYEMTVRSILMSIKRKRRGKYPKSYNSVYWIDTWLGFLNDREHDFNNLVYVSRKGALFPVDISEVRNFVYYGEPW